MDGAVPAIDVGHWAAHNLGTDFYGVHAIIAVYREEQVVGTAVLHNRTKYDCELSYYGPGSVSISVLSDVARVALEAGMIRLTTHVRSDRKRLARQLTRIGLRYEGRMRDYCGPDADSLIYAVPRELMVRLARRAT